MSLDPPGQDLPFCFLKEAMPAAVSILNGEVSTFFFSNKTRIHLPDGHHFIPLFQAQGQPDIKDTFTP